MCFWYFLFRRMQLEVCVDMLVQLFLYVTTTQSRGYGVSTSNPAKMKNVGIMFALQIGLWKWYDFWKRETRCNQNANRKTEEKVGLYQTIKTNYTNSNNGLNYLIQKVRKILLICKRSILEFLNDEFISVELLIFWYLWFLFLIN